MIIVDSIDGRDGRKYSEGSSQTTDIDYCDE